MSRSDDRSRSSGFPVAKFTGSGCRKNNRAWRAFLAAYERRLLNVFTHEGHRPLHGCLQTGAKYDEATAWSHRAGRRTQEDI
ncbi:hypothetical protein Mro03_81260 [Microbispora rosea subsp. rosea]|nr:hypothetical protein Mro03_81260 [Microbispora rosea subsp. rosea]